MRNIIFLDVDGVLCTPLSHSLNKFRREPIERQRFDPISLYWLRHLARRAQAEVVLSSTWRDGLMMDDPFCRSFIENLFRRLEANGTPLVDVTPMVSGGDKGEEIAAWLSCSQCERYAILDDNDCFRSHPEIRAHWVPIPRSRGIRWREAANARSLLL